MDTGTGAITAIHLGIIVVLTVLTIFAIGWGMKLKRARVAAAEEFAENEKDTRAATKREQADLGADPLQDAAREETQSQSQVQSSTSSPMQDAPASGAPPETGPLANEPIAAAAPMEASFASEAAPESAAPAPSSPAAPLPADRSVTVLKGLGPKVAAALADRGITTVGQIASLDGGQADALDADLGAFKGRMARDRWIEQARFLAAGDVKGFEAVFGRL